MSSSLKNMSPASTMRLLEFTPSVTRVALLDASDEAREATAVHLALDLVRQVRASLSEPRAPLGRFDDEWVIRLVRYLGIRDVVPHQLMEADGRPLRQLLADAVRSTACDADGAVVVPCQHMRDVAAWVGSLLSEPLEPEGCCTVVRTCDDAPAVRFMFFVGVRRALPFAHLAPRGELKWTPLHRAVANGHVLCLRYLLSQDDNPSRLRQFLDLVDTNGNTAVHLAALLGHAHCIEVLHKAGADVNRLNRDRHAPAHCAAKRGNVDCIEALHAAAADLTFCDWRGESPLYVAVSEGHARCVAAFRRAKVDLRRLQGPHAVSLVFVAAFKGHADCITELTPDVDVDLPDENGWTPAFAAAARGHAACLTALHRAGADLNRVNSGGRTPAYVAAQRGHFACLQALRDAGVDVTNSARVDR